MSTARVFGVFAKCPTAGSAKTRLAAARSAEWAAHVAEAFLADTLDRHAKLPVRQFLVFAPDDALEWFARLAAGRYELLAQGEGDLGDRMARFIDGSLGNGAASTVVIGADSPTLPREFIEQAFVKLESADAVLGPATDGGFCLLGSRRPLGSLLDGVEWGSAAVLRQTAERFRVAKWRMSVLPPWYDVDDITGWEMLRGHVAALRSAGIDPGVPRVEALLRPELT